MSFSSFLPLLLLLIACQPSPENVEDQPIDSVAQPEPEVMPTPLDTVPASYLLGKFDPAKDSLFVRIDDRLSGGSARGKYLRKETHEAFEKMWQAAKDSGISLTILSATRPFNYQKGIWEAKWMGVRRVSGQNLAQTQPDPVERARMILRYSSMPGTSRHHWGTDIDLNAFENSYFESGKGLKEYEWLQAHAGEYGFCQPYTPKGDARPNGYEEEKWHWSYLPLANTYMLSYDALVSVKDISGFKGAEAAEPLNVIEHYVRGINADCLP